jgi:hypothetical protein
MKNGRLYNGNTLDEVYPTARKTNVTWEQSKPGDLPGIRK